MTGGELIALHPHEWHAATRHPFLDSVREDRLADEAFRTWLQQDNHFLRDLLDFEATLLPLAPAHARQLLDAGMAAVRAELAWFVDVAEESSIELDAVRLPAVEAYRRFLSSVDSDFSKGLTALWVGERAYLEAWQSASSPGGRYKRFVDHWTTREFEEYVLELEALLGANADEATFLEGCRHETAFWEMAWNSAKN